MTRRKFRRISGVGGGPSLEDVTKRQIKRRCFRTIQAAGVTRPRAVGFWGSYNQSSWATGIDFPGTWTKLFSRTKDNLDECDVLVVGRYIFSDPYTSEPSTTADRDAVADWITAGGVLFVIHEYYGSPSLIPITPVDSLNAFLSYIGAATSAGTTSGIAPNGTSFPSTTYSTSVSHPLLAGVDKLWTSAPGFMNIGSATLLFEARSNSSSPWTSILSVETYGAGSIVFCADFSMVNNSTGAAAITGSGNKINVFLSNL